MITNVSTVVPDELPAIVTLAKAKKQLRVEATFEDEDDLIQGYIDTAVEASEQYINGHIYPKSMVISMDAFQSSLVFEAYPVRSITSVKYFKDDVEVTLATDQYKLTSENLKQSKITFKSQPSTDVRSDAVVVTIAIGFESAAKVPKPIIQAILLQVSEMYEKRESRPEVKQTTAQALMRSYKKYL